MRTSPSPALPLSGDGPLSPFEKSRFGKFAVILTVHDVLMMRLLCGATK